MRLRLLTAVLLLLGLGACSSATAAGPAAPTTARKTISFVVVGDSITAGTQAIQGTEVPGTGSWIPGAEGEPLAFGGGWAVPGATTAAMRDGVARSDADAVVVLGGTNDLLQGVPWSVSRENLLAIVRTTGVDDVVLSTIPPCDRVPEQRQQYNDRLRALAADQGWHLVDPWTRADSDGSWVPGASGDGIHPTPEVAGQAGRLIRTAVLDSARG
ncbi:SGNH/GDSL hydrolase family protein [Petropleomorpha daqingensis]|uniref:Lysophospholipase L1-like esterase n=1 Tax=Petropleomorpha daqingensis TaxID=2026353 RepID=A0A853C9L8_9ACTN|nr:SGNH/GDSL hydrolase family protein [Petropleomorpha daqingensis]NYJ04650.1 lysophospholipase L1-like esterase [Petropleomorpha daqingensis]